MSALWQSFVRYWTTLEWFGLRFYVVHLWAQTKEIYGQDLRPLRIAFAFPSFGVAFWLWESSVAYSTPGFRFISHLMGENTLGAVFFLHGIGLVWRVYALSRQMMWSVVFGFIGMVLYFGYPYFVWVDIGRKTGQGIAMAGWGVVALWAVSRLGTGEDRSGP